MSCFFYLCLYTINAYNGYITIGVIQQILKLAGNRNDVSEKIIDIFTKLDLNKDGVLSLRQFFTLLDKIFNKIEPLFAFRDRLLDYCFTDNSYRIIFRRKLQYSNTKAYMKTHNNELPSLSCIDEIINLFTGNPHPMKFDYEDEIGTISFSKITQIMIRKYRPDSEEVKKRAGIHYLGLFKDYIVTREIDCFYLQLIRFKDDKDNSTNGFHKDSNGTSYASSYSVASPAVNTLLSGNGGVGGRKISILKTPSYARKNTFHQSTSSMSLSQNNDTNNANYLKRKITLNNLQISNTSMPKNKGLSVVAETFLQSDDEE